MNIGRTANPTLNKNTFTTLSGTYSESSVMTIQGTVNKVFLMMILLFAGAGLTWSKFFKAYEIPDAINLIRPMMYGGLFGGLILAIITVFSKKWAAVTAPLYAIAEGLFLGGISAIYQVNFPGIVMQAVALTFATLFVLLFAYKSRLIKPTENFKLGVVAATGGIFFVYMLSFILGLFGINFGYIHSAGPLGIIISLIIVVIAALNLVLDFDFIEQGAEQGAPKYMEWYAAFGLMVTLVWLYLEILRLLAKIYSRR